MNQTPRTLLAIIEIGAYPNFAPLYQRHGYQVTIERSARKAISTLKRLKPAVIVAEFNYQSDFRDRTSSLESVFSVVQTLPGTKVIVFYDAEQTHQFERLRARFPIHAALSYPIDPARLEAALATAG
jgi:AmiR/NasT family two-component response regulator